MANKILEYKNRFRLRVPICESTHNFSRKLDGTLEDIDVYIDCSNGIKVFYYGRSIYEVYIPSLPRGRNILRQLYYENINPDNVNLHESRSIINDKEVVRCSYQIIDEYLYQKELLSSGFFLDVRELDSEVTFRFNQKNFEKIIPLLKPKTAGAGISPFSSKNLPKLKYEISDEELREYKAINDSVPKELKLMLSRITNDFIYNIMSKNKQYKKKDMKSIMRKKMLSGKEFIHSEGFWKEYIAYLKSNTELDRLLNLTQHGIQHNTWS